MYTFVIYVYSLAVRIASLFSKKARLMMHGHAQTFRILSEQIEKDERYIWFHASSLGEFEQARPLMEETRKRNPSLKILLTFFSPSGYEVRKNYEGADVVCYLPFDTPGNVKRFLDITQPFKAFFIKYEFWQNYLKELKRRNIPVYSVSSIFRKEQVFFRWYGGQYYKVLNNFSFLLVQNEESKTLLKSLGVRNALVVGDTRFDRVIQVMEQAKELPLIAQFKHGQPMLVAGSSWAPDEDLFIKYFNQHPELKLVIAPHVISESHIKEIIGKLKRPSIRYSQADAASVKDADCLIIDNFGMLSSIYRYGEVAYVGGGFGVGIHNILEAAVYGIPVLFGPNNKRFLEAQELKAAGGAFEITDEKSFNRQMDLLFGNAEQRQKAGQAAGNYVKGKSGATDKVLTITSL